MINIELPWPPSLNSYWRHVVIRGRPRTLITEKGRSYQRTCFALLRSMYKKKPNLVNRLVVRVDLIPPAKYGKRRWDIDNFVKVVFDVMTVNGVWNDDSQVDVLHIYRRSNEGVGAARISIEEYA